MNIHFTYDCPAMCAKHLDNSRVNKMLTETVQMITTAWWMHHHPDLVLNSRKKASKEPIQLIKDKYDIMAATHPNHPSTIWIRECRENMQWAINYAFCLFFEFQRRFGTKTHKSIDKLFNLMDITDFSFLPENGQMTDFANCARAEKLGIDYTHMDDVHSAYRLYLYDRWCNDKRKPTWSAK